MFLTGGRFSCITTSRLIDYNRRPLLNLSAPETALVICMKDGFFFSLFYTYASSHKPISCLFWLCLKAMTLMTYLSYMQFFSCFYLSIWFTFLSLSLLYFLPLYIWHLSLWRSRDGILFMQMRIHNHTNEKDKLFISHNYSIGTFLASVALSSYTSIGFGCHSIESGRLTGVAFHHLNGTVKWIMIMSWHVSTD